MKKRGPPWPRPSEIDRQHAARLQRGRRTLDDVAGGHSQRTLARRRRRDTSRNLDAIVEAARQALAADPDASMQDVAVVAGLHRATVHRHFPTRLALVSAVRERAAAEAGAELRAARPSEGAARAALERATVAAIGVLERYGFAPGDDGTVAAILARGQREEGLRADVTPDVLAAAWGALVATLPPVAGGGGAAAAAVVQVLLGPV
jgi:AcrR family transcriptional regulator